ncbi:MAG: chromosome partition protein MukB [Myxococcota bacterium]
MNRARATALALVNWKGVFFERYQLDRHVTALEGANGAGKTTVMIAAYVVLLPDMTRLRFTNLGESAATSGDRGVWGRLGEPGRPSYSALDFEYGNGQRVLAGVQLARKAEPSVELVPFLVSGLDASLRLSDLLLMTREGHDEVPSLDEFAAHVRARGAKLEVFQSAKEYFSALFERGITPLRLSSDEERNKLNEMLRTSMTGGISRALTSELRGFLLREESGLSDTLRRMRDNLEACRRTRIEVTEARTLEHEISSIYDAGQAMFAAAFGAARKRSQELGARAQAAEAELERARTQRRSLEALLSEASAREAAHVERRQHAQREYAESQELARRAEQARSLAAKLSELTAEREQAHTRANEARALRERSSQRRKELKQQRELVREGYERAARGLSDSERGLDELHRNAADQRRARRLLDEARTLLEQPAFEAHACERTSAALREQLSELDRERARNDRLRELAALRARERDEALAALRVIVPDAEGNDAHTRARRALAELMSLEQQANQRDDLARKRDETAALATRQRALQNRISELGIDASGSDVIAERLSAVEVRLRGAEESNLREAALAESARTALTRCQHERRELEARCLVFDELCVRRERLAAATGGDTATREGLARLHAALFGEREQLRQRFRAASDERAQISRARSALESGGGSLDAELLALCEELDGELLASRFDDIDVADAALLEAELGPLARAIVVDDVERAAAEVLSSKHALEQVILVAEGADPRNRIEAPRAQGHNALIREHYGVRIVRLPERPSLGFRARKRRAEELTKRASELDAELEALEAQLQSAESALRECEELSARGAALDLDDPRPRLTQLGESERQASEAVEAHQRAADAALLDAANARNEREALMGLSRDAFLLDAPDHSQRAEQLAHAYELARSAERELSRIGSARKTLTLLLDALVDDSEAAAVSHEAQAGLDERRDRTYRAVELLGELERVRHVLALEDAELALKERTRLLPALEAQHDSLRQALEQAESAVSEIDAEWESSALALAEAEAARAAVEAHAERLTSEIAELALDGNASEASTRALASLEQWAAELERLEREERNYAAERAVRSERLEQARVRLEALTNTLAEAQSDAEPANATYTALREAAERAHLPLFGEPSQAALSERSSAELAADAASKLDLLWGRLSTARAGAEIAQRLQAELDASSSSGDSIYLKVWLLVREWLSRRVPAQIANVDDPLLSLEKLRDQLSVLEHRLTRQELDLRGASEDVARGIEVGLRRAKAQVRRLNQSLDGVAFGSIQGLRVRLTRVERMDQVLTALRSGAAQELLFQSNLPIEEALNEIFKRFAGGKTGGQRLLDYREYLELCVEIRRQTGTDWEVANPSRLSTGEAIGVGATLMMVILTEWERDANLLRGKRAAGTLRFLFLDEANRLSQDNLGVLFELCKHLELQLLIAAPEVARADGNTTYRLVRRLTDDGREEVLVSGRRVASAVTETHEEELPAPAPPAEPGQLSLLSDSVS